MSLIAHLGYSAPAKQTVLIRVLFTVVAASVNHVGTAREEIRTVRTYIEGIEDTFHALYGKSTEATDFLTHELMSSMKSSSHGSSGFARKVTK